MRDLQQLENEIVVAIESATDVESIEAVRIAIFGKKGTMSEQLRHLGQMSPEERQSYGALLNQLKVKMQNLLVEKQAILQQKQLDIRLAQEAVDVTLPVREPMVLKGRLHPISQLIEEITTIFSALGFSVATGPDIETDYYNFTALNFPEGHPAREMHDTFFLPPTKEGEARVLRTHTSPVQIRTMEKQKPPIRIIIPGKTYRMDSDATHSPMFHQLEGLVIDQQTNIAQMKWVLEAFCREFFEIKNLKMRFRPSFFPFTEPSMEVDIQCDRSSAGIRIGEGEDWMEILGCGMVHPNVLRHGGIDPEQYQGFAWGIGIDRLAMLKYGMSDLRAFFNADVRWSAHYGFRAFDLPHLLANFDY